MCLLLFSSAPPPMQQLVLAANRDEFYARASSPAHFWADHDHVLAGRDLEHMGTWLGLSRRGRWAALTNYREPDVSDGRTSRGSLVSDFLTGDHSVDDYLQELDRRAADFAGFNLVIGDGEHIVYFSNRGQSSRRLEHGVYGMSNHLLDTPWPKVIHGRRRLRQLLAHEVEFDHLFGLLADQSTPADEDLPDTGVGLETERMLGPAFITSAERGYGTRCSTVILLNGDGRAKFEERTFVADGQGRYDPGRYRSTAFEFTIDMAAPAGA